MFLNFIRNLSSSTASVTTVHRKLYARMYDIVVVRPDGSSVRTRYTEPRCIIRLPLDLNDASEEERLKRLTLRRPMKKVKYVEDFDDNYDAKKYLQFVKKVKK